MERGLIQIYTGDGKGKTTAAIGQAVRALGRGLRVVVVQFLKAGETGEVLFFNDRHSDRLEFYRFNQKALSPWTEDESEKEILKQESLNGIKFAYDVVRKAKCDILILDEVFGAINKDFISSEEIKVIINEKPRSMELILTGRNAPHDIIDLADLVTEMRKIKHPVDDGIFARFGIEK